MKKIIILFILIASILIANDKNNGQKDEFGFAVGANIGYGLSYKYRLDDSLALRVTGGFIINDAKSYNLGLEINYSLKKNNDMDFYFSVGGLHTYEENYGYRYDDEDDIVSSEKDTRGMIGLGISSYFFNTISVSLEVHQVFEYSTKTDRDTRFNIYPMIGFTAGFLF